MKKPSIQIVFAAFFGLFQLASSAQTIISSSPVSGTWTTLGSPYIVTVPVTVNSGQVLTISPGVVVQFMPDVNLWVDGQLIAAGTSIAPITFEANDTTSWSDTSSNLGGWGGIRLFPYYDPAPDNSIFKHCTIRDVKATPTFYSKVLQTDRELEILNCDFYHNRTFSSNIILTTANVSDTILFDNCLITNSFGGTPGIIQTANIGGYTEITNSELSYNHGTAAIFAPWTNLLIENNLIHHNDQMLEMDGAIALREGTAIIRGNKIYFNECGRQAGLGCFNCISLIENNLICNNTNYSPACGLTGGGGGMFISGDYVTSNIGNAYIIRNNIIANNYYDSNAGGGIFVFFAKAFISNNHIINNTAGFNSGSGIGIWGDNGGVASKVYIKNNIFFSKSPFGIVESAKNIYCAIADELLVENNYLPDAVHKSVFISSAPTTTMIGDTLTNIIGTTPDMISPTIDNNFATDATVANFDLFSFSPCIDKGDTTGSFSATFDYAGSNRISNGFIDIGAYEFQDANEITEMNETVSLLQVFPNPAMNSFVINFENEIDQVQITVSDLKGSIVFNQNLNKTNQIEINSSNFPAGVYSIAARSQNFSISKKMVIVK